MRDQKIIGKFEEERFVNIVAKQLGIVQNTVLRLGKIFKKPETFVRIAEKKI